MKTYILKESLPGKQFEIAEFTFNRLPAEEKMLYIENTDNFPDADEQQYIDIVNNIANTMYEGSKIPKRYFIEDKKHLKYDEDQEEINNFILPNDKSILEEPKETRTNQNKKKYGKNSSDTQSNGA